MVWTVLLCFQPFLSIWNLSGYRVLAKTLNHLYNYCTQLTNHPNKEPFQIFSRLEGIRKSGVWQLTVQLALSMAALQTSLWFVHLLSPLLFLKGGSQRPKFWTAYYVLKRQPTSHSVLKSHFWFKCYDNKNWWISNWLIFGSTVAALGRLVFWVLRINL